MRTNSLLSVGFGLFLLLLLPFMVVEKEKPEPGIEEQLRNNNPTECLESNLRFSDRLRVCNAQGVKWYHYTGRVDSAVQAEIDRLWEELK